MPYLIVGLGNPGYDNTYHNIGFDALDSCASHYQFPFTYEKKVKGWIGKTTVGTNSVLFLKPKTYMNASGEAVLAALSYWKLPIEKLLIIVDDVALPFGHLRLRSQGSEGGHKGLGSITNHLHTTCYSRLRIGIGAPLLHQELSSYVLSKYSKEEREKLPRVIHEAIEAIELWIKTGVVEAMNQINTKKKDES